jgi:uncharacterized protein (TIGR00297 family)
MLEMPLDQNQWGTLQELVCDRLVVGGVVTLLFAGLARGIRGVNLSGALVGFVISLILYVSAGPGAFALLVCVFVLTSFATRLGYRKKQKLGTAEKREGRTGSQVVANLGVATVLALLFAIQKNSIYMLAAVAALAEVAADTVSSEYGQTRSHNPRLITTWKTVPPGTDGAISASGTVAGLVAALIVSLVAVGVKVLPVKWIIITSSAAVSGMFCDSWLGASLERRRVLNNNAVNFVSTLIAAMVAILMASVYG